ncbi:hypothetical protein MN116_003970 [Schistosoma mekongi]|uniref:Ephrin RBD domain-containing protein n=1 Tax=Schistosoma mekongi TaxID=38744 RepID=A0AAE1ZEC7_SCHME|nr:hypothetical protein MN116_003970 [Schistosoma mekongi]
MYKTCLMEITVMILIEFTSTELRDHIILWDASNWRFKENRNNLYATEGDNLIFICPKNRTFSQNLYWTNDSRLQLKCNKTMPIKVIKLLDCYGNKSVTEFILKVSRFPEIASLPSFHREIPVYFVAQSVICQQNNFRLSVKLMSDNMTNITEQEVSSKENQTIKHSSKFELFLNASSFSQTKTISTQNHLNNSSNIFWNPTHTMNEQIGWNEYRFLLVPATLAFFVLISIQIVLCGFWFSNSIIKQLIKCFKKCKCKHDLQLKVNHISDNRKIIKCLNESYDSMQLTDRFPDISCYKTQSNHSCWQTSQIQLSTEYKQQKCTHFNWLFHYNQSKNYTPLYKFNNCDQQHIGSHLLMSTNPDTLPNIKVTLTNQTIPDTSTVLCNCIDQSMYVNFMQNQDLYMPVYLNTNIIEN